MKSSNALEVSLSGETADFIRTAVKHGEAADPRAYVQKLLQEEMERRFESLQDDLEAALASGEVGFTREEIESSDASAMLRSRLNRPVVERVG